MAELKPCPFCGGKAERAVKPLVDGYYFDTVAYCVSCGCTINQKCSLPRWVKKPESEAKRRIARLWNRREKDGK